MRTIVLLTLLALAPALLWYALAHLGVIDWPKASDPFGVFLGIVGAIVIVFELLLAPRKWLRGWRLGAARVWMRWHIWLGLAVLPMIILHSGFRWGGNLSTITMVLFLLVIFSGIYGLILQQWLPQKLFDVVPSETIASQVQHAIAKPLEEAKRIVIEVNAPVLDDFFSDSLEPFLLRGAKSKSPLASATLASRLFARLRAALPDEAAPAIYKLEKTAELRRQWERQVRITWWLHNWLIVHLPLSVLMTGLMVIHALYAMKWW